MFLIGDHDVFASFANTRMDGERYRAPVERGLHMAEPVPRIECASEKF